MLAQGPLISVCFPACNSDQHICSLGALTGSRCINSSQICDGVADCVGGEDEQGVRLVDGVLPMQGRVEHCSNGEWHTICDDRWDNNDAKVVCRQLGYESQGNFVCIHSANYIALHQSGQQAAQL